MSKALTFIVPVRHPENSTNWSHLKAQLGETARSIAAQDCDDWRAIVVANRGADLPALPQGFEVAWVEFPPNERHRQGDSSQSEFYDAVRSDKGRRILAGMLQAGELGHVMVCDDDDFVSRRLASFVVRHRNANGWYFRDGYVWSDGGVLLYRHSNFSRLCGSSHILRSDLLQLPASLESADETYIRQMLGSHVFVHDHLEAKGTPLEPLPFIGAIYRTGHGESHSRSQGVIAQFFLQRYLLTRPWQAVGRVSRVRIMSTAIRREFFGA